MILLFTQAYLTHGGMQTYMRRIAEIATDYCREREEVLDCISLTDVEQDLSQHRNPVQYGRMIGCAGSRTKFLFEALVRRGAAGGICVVGHLALASTALVMKRLGIISDYVIVLHGIEAWAPNSPLVRYAARKAAGLIATTRFTAKEFQIQNGFAAANVFIIPLSVEESIVNDTAPEHPGPELRVLTVGRLDQSERYKGFDELIQAVRLLRIEDVAVKLRIVGTGNDSQRLISVARQSGVASDVQFLGSISDDALRREYQTCDVFALPSKKEGFGLVFLEAMRYGKPCIGGRHGGTPEVIRDSVDGYLVEFGETEQLVQKLKYLYKHPEKVQSLGKFSVARVRTEFTYPVMRRRWRAAFHSIRPGEIDVRHRR